MRIIEYFLGGAFGLIIVYLLLVNPKAASDILGSLGALGAQTFGTLQGRSTTGGGVSVGSFQR